MFNTNQRNEIAKTLGINSSSEIIDEILTRIELGVASCMMNNLRPEEVPEKIESVIDDYISGDIMPVEILSKMIETITGYSKSEPKPKPGEMLLRIEQAIRGYMGVNIKKEEITLIVKATVANVKPKLKPGETRKLARQRLNSKKSMEKILPRLTQDEIEYWNHRIPSEQRATLELAMDQAGYYGQDPNNKEAVKRAFNNIKPYRESNTPSEIRGFANELVLIWKEQTGEYPKHSQFDTNKMNCDDFIEACCVLVPGLPFRLGRYQIEESVKTLVDIETIFKNWKSLTGGS